MAAYRMLDARRLRPTALAYPIKGQATRISTMQADLLVIIKLLCQR
jgi:hypothetical protein